MDQTKNKDTKIWRSFESQTQSKNYQDFVSNEFPQGAQELTDPTSRRNFMKIMGASAALAGLTACRMPKEEIVPFVKSPKNLTPGKPKFYATSMNIADHVQGLLVENNEGRPTKIEGNNLHPSSMGSLRHFEQASILALYDPERKKVVSQNDTPSSWSSFETFWREQAQKHQQNQGKDLAIIAGTNTSPTIARLQKDFMQKFPQATWAQYEAIDQQNILQGLELISGQSMVPYYHFDQADLILSIGHDFLGTDLDAVRHQKGFSSKRRVHNTDDNMNRLYIAESSYSLTGSNADHRIRLSGAQMQSFAEAIYQELAKVISLPKQKFQSQVDKKYANWIQALVKDLVKNKRKSIVSAGIDQTPQTHALVHMINQALGNTGQTVSYRKIQKTDTFDQLHEKLSKKQIKTLVVLDSNPVYTQNLNLGQFDLDHVLVASTEQTETSTMATWNLPLSHYLESWGDAQSTNGSTNIVQPMIRPLFDSKSMVEIVYMLTHLAPKKGYEIVQDTWKNQKWDQILHDGVRVQNNLVSRPGFSFRKTAVANKSQQEGIEIQFKPSPNVYDGRFANNGWLQEMPHPITKITWDNPAWVSPRLAKEKGLKNGQMIELSNGSDTIKVPVWIVPGQADQTITLEMGYGRKTCGSVGKNVGFDVYPLRKTNTTYYIDGFSLNALAENYSLSTTQEHGSMEDRPLAREATLADFRKNPDFAKEAVEHPPLKSLWNEHNYDQGYQWGMSIDLNTCTGCNACLISCQSENNIPIVGKEQVKNGREMHWIRLDRYFNGDAEDPMIVFQPVTCAHCENAPCEQVCPVNATVHDDEGLNTMVYNRCIGTRYCSNNCPYKVRRFNFFNYVKESPLKTHQNKIVQMANNPEVSIRFRGVMEKCTYCTQRIEHARSDAKLENRNIQDGEIKTACQQSCPSDAIVFGNINDPNSEVSKLKKLNQDYAMLSELNIKPRTTYLAKLRNPNPEIAGSVSKTNGSHAS